MGFMQPSDCYNGGATTAAFTITLRMVEEEEGYIARPFFREFKNNLGKGSIIGIIQLVAVYAIYLDFQLSKVEGKGTMLTVGHCLKLLACSWCLYLNVQFLCGISPHCF